MSLRHGEDHRVFHRAGIKLRRADEIADVFEHREINVGRAELIEPLLGHPGIQMAHAAGVELYALHTRACNRLGVHGGIDVRFHNADAKIVLQLFDRAQKRRRLARARRGHEIEKERLFRLESCADAVGLAVVVGKNALLDLYDSYTVHFSMPRFL